MSQLIALFEHYGVALVFAAVLVEQLGAPLPALPVMIVAGAIAASDPLFGLFSAVAALAASGIGGFAWYWAGLRHGDRVLRMLCRISLSPDSCVRRSRYSFQRWGLASLTIAKFIPGMATVAPPLAGMTGIGAGAFLLFSGIGALLWSGVGLAVGLVFHDRIDGLLRGLADLGGYALWLVALLLALYVAYRAWERRRFMRSLRMARIGVEELYRLMTAGESPVILDVRGRDSRARDGRRIPGARAVDLDDLERAFSAIPRGRDVVIYCACPNDASAVEVARQLKRRGYERVRPLAGGIDAWVSAGLSLEEALSASDER